MPTQEDIDWFSQVKMPELQMPDLGGTLMNGLEMLGRPISAISSGVAAGLQGRDVGAAMSAGLQGQSPIRGFADVLEQQGVGELGRLQVGPLDVTGRGALGFGADVLADPLTWTGAGLGKAASMIGGRAPMVGKALAAGADVANMDVAKGVRAIKGQAAAKPVTSLLPEAPDLTKHIEAIARPSLQRTVANLPGINRVAGLVSPAKVANDLPQQSWIARQAAIQDVRDRIVPTASAQFKATVPQRLRQMDKNGVLHLPDGTRVFWGDFAENPGKYGATAEETAWLNMYTKVKQELHELGAKYGVTFKEMTKDDEGWQYVGRMVRGKPNVFNKYRKRIGGELGHQKQRGYETGVEGIEAGWEYMGPIEALETDLRNVYSAIVDKQFRTALEPIAKVTDIGKAGELKATIRGLTGEYRTAKGEAERADYLLNKVGGPLTPVPSHWSVSEKVNPQTISVALSAFPLDIQRTLASKVKGVRIGGVERGERGMWDVHGKTLRLEAGSVNDLDTIIHELAHAYFEEFRDTDFLAQYIPLRYKGKSVPEMLGAVRRTGYADYNWEAQHDLAMDLTRYLMGQRMDGRIEKLFTERFGARPGIRDAEAAYQIAYNKYDDITQQLEDVERQFAERDWNLKMMQESSGIIRPKNLFVGWSDEDVLRFAQQEGRNPYRQDWWDRLDPVALADARTSRTPGGRTGTIADMRAEMAPLRTQIRQLRQQKAATEREMKMTLDSLGYPDTGELQQTLTKAQGRMGELGGEIKGLREQRAEALHPGRTGYVSTGQPILKDMYFQPEVAARISKALEAQPNPFWKFVNDVGQWSRLMMTGFDMGGGMIQGLPILFMNPLAWSKAQVQAFKALQNPDNYSRFLASERVQKIAREIPGLILGQPEPLEIIGKGGRLERFGKGAMRRPQAAFDAFGTAARVYMAEGLLPTYKAMGKVDELADFLNKMTGVMSSAAIGVGPTQRAVEAGMVAFAPRYLRASLGLVADALTRGDIKGWHTRQALASMMVGGMAMYMKLAELAGQEPVMDPTDSKFMTLQMGTDRVGIGSIWTSLGRLLAKSIDDPGSLAKVNPREWEQNPLLRWMRSRTPPVPSMTADLLNGKTYIGDELIDGGDYLRWGIGRFIPFAAESRTLQNPPADIATLMPEMLGARVFPQSFADRREQIAQEQYQGRGYHELGGFEQQDVMERAKALGIPLRGEEAQARESAFQTQGADLGNLAQQVANNEISKNQYREARGDVKLALSTRLEDVEAMGNKGKTPEEIAKAKDRRNKKLPERELDRQRYFEILQTKDALGKPNFEEADAFLVSLPMETQQWIEETGMARLQNLPPEVAQLETELRQARNTLKPYWEVLDQVLVKKGLKAKWDAMTPREQEEFKASKEYNPIESEVGKRREAMRQRNKAIDAALVEWYGYTPINQRQTSGGGIGRLELPGLKGLTAPSNLTTSLMRLSKL